MSVAKVIIKTLGNLGEELIEKSDKVVSKQALKIGKKFPKTLTALGAEGADPFIALRKLRKDINADLPFNPKNKVSFYKIEGNPALERRFKDKSTLRHYDKIVSEIKNLQNEFQEYLPNKKDIPEKEVNENKFWLKKNTDSKYYQPENTIEFDKLETLLKNAEDEITEKFGEEFSEDVFYTIGKVLRRTIIPGTSIYTEYSLKKDKS